MVVSKGKFMVVGKTVLSRYIVFAYDEVRRDIYGVVSDSERWIDRYELVAHIDSDTHRYHKCMTYLSEHFNRSIAGLSENISSGKETTYSKHLEAYVIKPYTNYIHLPKDFHKMTRKEIIEQGKDIENRAA
ncbi:MAG: hypothetical protein OXF22_08485 [Anaerolineaceae bacterium]|nr:hypothetical protein [Anaerolineaceae bacterium]